MGFDIVEANPSFESLVVKPRKTALRWLAAALGPSVKRHNLHPEFSRKLTPAAFQQLLSEFYVIGYLEVHNPSFRKTL